MNRMINGNIETFSTRTDTKTAIKHLIELSKHQLYNQDPNNFSEFERFSNGKFSYKEKNSLVHAEIKDVIKTALDISDEAEKQMIGLEPELGLFSRDDVRKAYFAVVAKAIDEQNIATDLQAALPFAEVQNLADGDSGIFHIGSKNVIQFEEDANGKRNSLFDKVYNRDVKITPTNRKGTVAADMYKIAAGKEDLGLLVNKVTRGMRLSMSQEVIDLLFATSNLAANSIYLNSFAQDTFQQNVEELGGLNGSDEGLMAFGVRSALAPVLPTNDNLKFGLGTEIMKQGYVSDLFGVPAVRLQQLALTGVKGVSNNFVIPNNHIIIASTDQDKIVKICMEGRTKFRQSKDGDTADDVFVYTVESKWKMAIASQSHFLLIKTR